MPPDTPTNTNAPHILASASNLLGFSFLALSSLNSLGLAKRSFLDEIVGLCVVASALSCFFSFLSIRSHHSKRSERFEAIADTIFFGTLLVITVTSILLVVDIIDLT